MRTDRQGPEGRRIVVNEKKSRLVPTQELRFLGLELNTSRSEKNGAPLTGMLASMSLALGATARAFSHELLQLINNAPAWHSKVSLSTEAIHELHFWAEQFDRFNGAPFHHPHHYDAIIHVDASAHSWGATLSTFHGTPSNASAGMPDNMWPTSSTRRKLEGVLWVLRTFMDRLRHGHTLVRVDNQGVIFILRKGGLRNNELTLTCKEIITLCTDNVVRLAIEWIPRDQNTCADELSKLQDHDDYTLKQPWFRLLDRRWGPHSVDLFANAQNALLPRFFSKVPHPRAEAINAFSKDWHGERGFTFPPPHLVPTTLHHARRTRAKLTLVHQMTHEFIASEIPSVFQKGVIPLLMYTGFLRFSDLVTIQWQDIQFEEAAMWLLIPHSKTDQEGKGIWVPITTTPGPYCPVNITRQFISLASYDASTKGPLIRVFTRDSKATPHHHAPSYPTVRNWCLEALKKVGLNANHLGTHSFRKGAATTAEGIGVSDRMFKQLGRWRSDNAKDLYVTIAHDQLVAASQLIQDPTRAPSPNQHQLSIQRHRRPTTRLSQKAHMK
ncbi:unnamed protein product [Closterium sp. NIES-53]